jgi:poly-gamma-glutamate capsule biosynthesis protein CapA/YwtB (metallophosphatase superfamily)
MLAWWGLAASAATDDGVRALREGRVDDAVGLLAEAVAADPTDAEGWWQLGWAAWTLGDPRAAAEAWGRVEALEPSRPDLGTWLQAARVRARLASVPLPTAPPPTAPTARTVRVVAGGDTMMGSDLRRGAAGLAPGDGASLFDDTRALFQAADVAFLNLEGPLADDLPSTKCAPGSTACYAFRTPTRYAAALEGIGLDLAQLANNHAFDLGVEGNATTMRALDARGIAHAGRWGDVGYVERGGLRIALVAAHSGTCCLNVNDLPEVQRQIALADEQSDLVVFAFHGGREGAAYRNVPKELEIAWGERRGDVHALARAAVDAGADLVIGTGPHVLRAMEVYQGRLIAYSLGNFMGYRQFGTGGGPTGRTVALDATLADNGVLVSARLHPLALDGASIPRPDPTGAALQDIRELSAADFPETGVRVAADGALSWGPP